MATDIYNADASLCALPNLLPPDETASPFRIANAQYRAALNRFNDLPHDLERSDNEAFEREHDAFITAVNAVDHAPARTWEEFADAFEIACDLGQSLPNEDVVTKLLNDVRRLTGRPLLVQGATQ